jgi:cytoskeletal protein RodZ
LFSPAISSARAGCFLSPHADRLITTMTSIGPQLKAAREQSGMTPAQAAARLHMRAMFVEALEREDWSTVGEPVYVRGFIRNYARVLGLDARPFVEEFNERVGTEPVRTEYEPRIALENRGRGFRYPWLLGAMSIVAAYLVVKVVWTMFSPGAANQAETHPPAASALTTANGESQPQSGSSGVMTAQLPRQGVDLRLTLTQPCWLSIDVDGKRVVYQTLPAGTTREFRGVHQIALRAGNAGGVVATIDGQAIGTLGGQGQVQDRVFAANTATMDQVPAHE